MQERFHAVLVIAAMAFGAAGSAQAQSLGLSFSADGRIVAGYTDQVPGADIFLFGDATTHLAFGSSPLGFDLGVYGLANATDTPHETYGTFTWAMAGGGRVLLGVPRPAYDSFAVSAVDRMFPSLGVSNVATTRSLATYGAMFAGYLPYGLRYENAADGLRYALSVDTVPNRDTTIAGFGLGVPVGQMTLEAAVEVAWAAQTTVSGKLQLSGEVGRVTGGVGLYLPGTNGEGEMLEAFAAYKPGEKITIEGVVQIPLSNGDDMTAGLSARYDLSANTGISAGVFSDPASGTSYAAMLDWSF